LLVAVALAGITTAAMVALLHRSSGTASSALSRSSASSRTLAEMGRLPLPQRPAVTVRAPTLLSTRETRARYAPVLRRVYARRAPTYRSAPVATLELKTPEGTTNIVLVVSNRRRPSGWWAHVRLAVLPNNQTGWVPRSALGGYTFVHTRLLIERARLTAVLFVDGRKVFKAPIGIGTAASPTPAGEFYIRDRLAGFGDSFYGPVAFGTSARSAVLTDWPGGGFIGVHGTNEPALIPGRVSHGCIRMRNADILRLSRRMPVGTPVTIR
jgi:L,D-transpeptidase catalytic domain